MKMSKNYSALNSPELGRYAQLFLQQALQIANKADRQAAVEKIIDTQLEIGQISPKLREETRLKIWMQILALFDYQLNVDLPENLPLKADLHSTQRIAYPQKQRENRDYGLYFHQFVEKVATAPDGEKAEGTKTLLAYMRLIHQNLQSEEISPAQLKADLYRLSKGRIDIDADWVGESASVSPSKTTFYKHPNFQKKPKQLKK